MCPVIDRPGDDDGSNDESADNEPQEESPQLRNGPGEHHTTLEV